MPISPEPVQATRIRYVVLAWICAAAIVVYIQRTAMGVAATRIRGDLGLSEVDMGWVMSGFFWAYGLSQIPMGCVGQFWGSRRGLVVSMLIASSLCSLVGFSWGFSSILVFWMGAGIATAGVFPSCMQSISAWFPRSRLALPSGLLGSAMSVGAAISATLTGILLSLHDRFAADADSVLMPWLGAALSWRGVFILYGLPGLLWAIAFGLWFRNRPAQHPQVNAAELELIVSDQDPINPQREQGAPIPWSQLFLGSQMLLLSGQQMFRSAGYAFFGTWFPTYLQKVHDVSIGWSGFLTSIPLMGVIFGGTLAGWLADWIFNKTGSRRLSRQWLGGGGQLVCALTVIAAWYANDLVITVPLIALGSIVMAFGGCCSYSVIVENARPHVAPAYGMMNMMGNIGAAVSPVGAGFIAKWYGWEPVLLMYAAFYFLSFCCWVGINPDKKLFTE
ncbi:MFS transporter [Planctomicrobium piriforme]|uniref:MFS transporter, ACS family, glucarate transporter n=1 Tax=Planctomicrobium piriforme TaxID=1576369 RepID=A0A1I3MIV2_9PLAN|nr:MFS transporter [Planctomicrobium piriforme]SFI96841.1 MFS transporter, ACS family, glucarate transporter [Planctomicrobium piriforme]